MSQQTIYILLGAALFIFLVMTVRDWMQGRRRDRKPTPAAGPLQQTSELSLPLRLQAYERLVVFMERIKPENLTARLAEPGLNASDLRMVMTRSVQAEYDHNVSQQIYVSTDAWTAVSNAKEQLVGLINSLSEKTDPDMAGSVLAKQLLELSLQEKDFPVNTALGILNAEAKKLMASRPVNPS